MRSKIEEYNARGTPVAGVLVEPIQGEGGDNYASAEFFIELQQVCKDVSAGNFQPSRTNEKIQTFNMCK